MSEAGKKTEEEGLTGTWRIWGLQLIHSSPKAFYICSSPDKKA